MYDELLMNLWKLSGSFQTEAVVVNKFNYSADAMPQQCNKI